jgi:4-amino-4-deoxy-L-arabinose transferase-like glycosyltransferase
LTAAKFTPRAPAIALAAFVLLWLVTLGTRSLVSADEGRYASLSLGMLHSGDWITPRLNGLLYFEKPPLQYWGGALALALLGVNEFAARLYPGLAGLATVFMLAGTARRLWGAQAGLHALLIGGATTWIVVNSHFLSLDAGLTAALTAVLCALLLAEKEGGRWMLAAWAAMALAILSKGLVGLLIPGAVLVLHGLWRLDFRFWLRFRWLPGLALLLALTVPWFWAVSARNPDFAWFFFVHEHFDRYLKPGHRREGAWWTFLPIALLGFMPWTGALPALLRQRRDDFAGSLLLVWAVFVLVFFSLSSSKLPSYILPMFPALVLLMARRVPLAGAEGLKRQLWLPVVLWGAALLALPWLAARTPDDTPPAAVHALMTGIAVGALVFLGAALGARQLLAQGRLSLALGVVAAAHLVATLTVLGSHERYGQLKSSVTLAPLIGADMPVFAVQEYDQTLPFYLRRPVVLVDYRDEFEFGQNHEPQRWIPTLDAFVQRWQAEPRAAAYMNQATYDDLRQRGLSMRTVFQDPRRVLVVKP